MEKTTVINPKIQSTPPKEEEIKVPAVCKDAEHNYFPATWESYAVPTNQQGLSKAIQKATSLICAKCLDIKYITDVSIPVEPVKANIEVPANQNGSNKN